MLAGTLGKFPGVKLALHLQPALNCKGRKQIATSVNASRAAMGFMALRYIGGGPGALSALGA
jgi:hypothetical protein